MAVQKIDEVNDTGIVLDDGTALSFEQLAYIVRELGEPHTSREWLPRVGLDGKPLPLKARDQNVNHVYSTFKEASRLLGLANYKPNPELAALLADE